MMRALWMNAAAASSSSHFRSALVLRAPPTPLFETRERPVSATKKSATSQFWPSPLWGFPPRLVLSPGLETKQEVESMGHQKLFRTALSLWKVRKATGMGRDFWLGSTSQLIRDCSRKVAVQRSEIFQR